MAEDVGTGREEWRLQHLTWRGFRERVPDPIDTVLLPAGTVEAHAGLALGTDNLIPRALARRVAPEVPALVAPTLPYGPVSSLDRYPGSLHVSSEEAGPYVESVIRALVRKGFRHVVVLNGHGGNHHLVDAARSAHRETGVRILVVDWWSAAGDAAQEIYGRTGGHATLEETAAMVAAWPDEVRPDEVEPGVPFRDGIKPYPYLSDAIPGGPDDEGPDHDPEKARAFFDRACEGVLEVIRDAVRRWEALDLPSPTPE